MLLVWGESDVGAGGCGWLFGNRENCHSLAPMVYRHPQRSISLVGLRTVTADLLQKTEHTLSQRGPIPIRLWLKVGMMCPRQKGNFGRGMVQYDTDLCVCLVAVKTTMGGTLMLRLPQGESVVMYMSLVSASAIAMYLE